jgi:uncharacterized protein
MIPTPTFPFDQQCLVALNFLAAHAVRIERFRQLGEQRQALNRMVEEQGKPTAELRARIEATLDPRELEDLSLPFKRRRKGRDSGVERLADWLWAQKEDGQTAESLAEKLLSPEKGRESEAESRARVLGLEGGRLLVAVKSLLRGWPVFAS